MTAAAIACSSAPGPGVGIGRGETRGVEHRRAAGREPAEGEHADLHRRRDRRPPAARPPRWCRWPRGTGRTPSGRARPARRRPPAIATKNGRRTPAIERPRRRRAPTRRRASASPTRMYAAPRAASSMPSVTMNDGSAQRTVSQPLTKPAAPPTATAAATASGRRPPVAHRQPEHDAAQAEHRADRQVDASGDEHQRHARGQQQSGRHLVGDGAQRGRPSGSAGSSSRTPGRAPPAPRRGRGTRRAVTGLAPRGPGSVPRARSGHEALR